MVRMQPSDVFSFGVVTWECLTTERPWSSLTDVIQIVTAVVVQNKRPALPPSEAVPVEMAALPDLICDCWHVDPEKRPTFQEVVMRLRKTGARGS